MSDETEILPRIDVSHSKQSASREGWVAPVIVLVAVVALAALGLAAWATFRPAPVPATDASSYTGAENADAKTKICASFTMVRNGVNLNTNLAPAGGDTDPAGALAVTANARLAMYDGGQYLLARLSPATPTDLADAVRKFANDLMDIAAGATAGLQNSDPSQVALLADAGATDGRITQLCK